MHAASSKIDVAYATKQTKRSLEIKDKTNTGRIQSIHMEVDFAHTAKETHHSQKSEHTTHPGTDKKHSQESEYSTHRAANEGEGSKLLTEKEV